MRAGADQEEKRTNEIGTIIPLLDTLPDSAVAGRVVTVDALLTQRALADYLLERGAAFLFTVKGNQKTLMDDIRLLMDEAMAERPPDFVQESGKPEHGRLERRSIWVSSEINDYVRFPGVGQVFAVHREVTEVKTGERSAETAVGVTSLDPEAASPKRLLELNRGHWRIEATHHVLDWSSYELSPQVRMPILLFLTHFASPDLLRRAVRPALRDLIRPGHPALFALQGKQLLFSKQQPAAA